MVKNEIPTLILSYIKQYADEKPLAVNFLQNEGYSKKLLLLITFNNRKILASFFDNVQKNRNFFVLSQYLQKQKNIYVPTPYYISKDNKFYITQYIGKENFSQQIEQWKTAHQTETILKKYMKVIFCLVELFFHGKEILIKKFPSRVLDKKNYHDDAQYFCKYFSQYQPLNSKIQFDIERLIDNIAIDKKFGFVSRDFQARNIIFLENQPYFIDFQDACLGSCYYDLASLLFSPSAGLIPIQREKLIREYCNIANIKSYNKFFYQLTDFILIRRLRSLGTYIHHRHGATKNKNHSLLWHTFKELYELHQLYNCFHQYKEIVEFIKQHYISLSEQKIL